MYSCININNTERKQIGVPILKRTDEMISEFDLDYERYYKLGKLNSQREKEFQEFLKRKQQIQFYLTNLIKILRIYFKENKYNFNAFYSEYIIYKKFQNTKKTRKKRPKSYKNKTDKYIYFKILKNLETTKNLKTYKPYLYPLDIHDKKRILFRKIKTERNFYNKTRDVKMSQKELKLYVDVFGSYPVNFVKKENTKNKKKKNKFNALKNYYYHSKSLDNKTHLLLKKGNEMKEKYFGGFDKMKKYVQMKYKNALNLKAKLVNKKIGYIINRLSATNKNIRSKNLINNKNVQYNSCSNINKNNDHANIKKNYLTNKGFYKINYSSYNITNLKSQSSMNKLKTIQNNSINNYNINNSQISTIDIKNRKNLRPSSSYEYLYKFGSQFSKTIKNSKKITQDISFSNKVFSMSKDSYNKVSKLIEKTKLKQINVLNLIKHDIFEQKRKEFAKFKYVKENLSGNLKVNIFEHVRKPKSKYEFVREYNVRRDLIRKYQDKDIYDSSSDEEKSNFGLFSENKKNIKNLILNPNKKIKIKLAVRKKL